MKVMAANAIKKKEITKEQFDQNPTLELISLQLGKGIEQIFNKDILNPSHEETKETIESIPESTTS